MLIARNELEKKYFHSIEFYLKILEDKKLIEPIDNIPSFYRVTTEGRLFSGFESKETEDIKKLDLALKRWNFETRKLPFYISIISVIIAFSFGVNSCVREQSKQSEIQVLKFELQSIKDTMSTYIRTKTRN